MSDKEAVDEQQVWRACPNCYGLGRVSHMLIFSKACPQCNGFAKVLGPAPAEPIKLVKTCISTSSNSYVLIEVPVKQASIT